MHGLFRWQLLRWLLCGFWSGRSPNEEHVEVLPSEDSPTETFRSFWGFSSARGVATVVGDDPGVD